MLSLSKEVSRRTQKESPDRKAGIRVAIRKAAEAKHLDQAGSNNQDQEMFDEDMKSGHFQRKGERCRAQVKHLTESKSKIPLQRPRDIMLV